MSNKPIIYFLCTGNSCRSQMAEGFGRHYLSDEFEVYSAGIEAHGVNPKAVEVMKDASIDISRQTSDQIDQDILKEATHVITLCGHADEVCPTVPAGAFRAHWGFDDPPKAEGSEAEKHAVFIRVRDEIEARIRRFQETGE
ncbi:arsenate reductase [Salsuginibacillus halophilus]|uniref:Arsenate reductase n=1 Tax=Salsuginibacillus halophilus TaxID=517424 RepID=A0A2P8HD46_9BACI|nr:arsenate reductase (thioredoxin) [Salsuginibacillus halophilus]PSL44051.1 arsenate reductase [Salsuginibacillus halophilus]